MVAKLAGNFTYIFEYILRSFFASPLAFLHGLLKGDLIFFAFFCNFNCLGRDGS